MTDPRVPPTGETDAIDKLRLLHPFRRLEALRIACDDALAIWRRYCAAEKPIEYVDSIVGMHHTVDETLPARALADVDRFLTGLPISSTVTHDYVEPTVAMQDEDLDFPPDIENVYYAIYNLHGLCAGTLKVDETVIVQQVANSTDVSTDDWARDWWTRCWDAWATRPDPVYAPVPELFDALACDLPTALAAIGPQPLASYGTVAEGLLHAILLALSGRSDLALDAVAIATGANVRDPELASWLTEYVYDLVPELIAVSPDRQSYAAIRGDRLAIRQIHPGAILCDAQLPYRAMRFVRYASARHLYVGGDLFDDIGVVGSFWAMWLDHQAAASFGGERRGRRTLAVIDRGALLACDRALVFGHEPDNYLDEGPVVAAALSPAHAATHDGHAVTLWDLETSGWRALPGPAAPQRLAIAGGKLFVTWANHTTSLHTLG